MSGGGVWLFQVGASSPMAVLAGGIVATYATTAVVATPLTFPLLGALYGLIGATISGLIGGSWILWAAVVWLVVAVCGLLHVSLSAFVVGSVLCVELGVITLFDI